MSNPAVEAAVAALDPWITRFLIGDIPYGGWFDAVNDPRLEGGRTIENRNPEATTSTAP
jgi:hypothetical protein